MIEFAFIPGLMQFMTLLAVMLFTLFITPVLQSFILRFESFMLFPFICAKCFCFWLNLIMNILLAYIWWPYFLLWGIVTSAILAVMHIYTEKQSK